MATIQTLQLTILTPASPAAGTATFSGAGTDGDTLTIDDGIDEPVVFELDDDETVTSGNILVTIGEDDEGTAAAVAAAIQQAYAERLLSVSVEVTGAVVTVTHLLAGDFGSSLAKSSTAITVADFDDGVDAVLTATVDNPAATPDVTIEKTSSGSYIFLDLAGNKVVVESNQYDFRKWYDVLFAAVQ